MKGSDRPYPSFLSNEELVSLLQTLRHDRLRPIDLAVEDLMTTTHDPEIASACFPRLTERGGYDQAMQRARERLREEAAKAPPKAPDLPVCGT